MRLLVSGLEYTDHNTAHSRDVSMRLIDQRNRERISGKPFEAAQEEKRIAMKGLNTRNAGRRAGEGKTTGGRGF